MFPLWLVPVTLEGEVGEDRGCTMFVDLGVYGTSSKPGFAGRAATLRVFEEFTLARQGFQALYAETTLTHPEFCRMFREHEQFYTKVSPTPPDTPGSRQAAPLHLGLPRRLPEGEQAGQAGAAREEAVLNDQMKDLQYSQ